MLNLDNIFNKFYPKSQTAGTGRKLYIMAWAIEIFVAMVGLTMAYIFFKKLVRTQIRLVQHQIVLMELLLHSLLL